MNGHWVESLDSRIVQPLCRSSRSHHSFRLLASPVIILRQCFFHRKYISQLVVLAANYGGAFGCRWKFHRIETTSTGEVKWTFATFTYEDLNEEFYLIWISTHLNSSNRFEILIFLNFLFFHRFPLVLCAKICGERSPPSRMEPPARRSGHCSWPLAHPARATRILALLDRNAICRFHGFGTRWKWPGAMDFYKVRQ